MKTMWLMKRTMMKNLYLATKPQKRIHHAKQVLQPSDGVERKFVLTSQGKASPRTEIKLTGYQLRELAWLFAQYGQKKPGWLRRRYVTNQRRTKQLNQVLREAGLDGCWCATLSNNDDWDGTLHRLWHQVNGGTLCK